MARKYIPRVYPVAAVEALDKQQEAIQGLVNSINRVQILMLEKKTPQEIWEHCEQAVKNYEAAVYPKET
jgi:ABC-type nitrate/sulfonate/bicarbonate transport system substrate-binding protein